MARKEKEETYFQEVAEVMVRQGLNFRRAAEQIGVDLLPEEADNLQRRKVFQRLLWMERYKYFEELGSDPNRTKNALLGQMVHAINKLLEEGEWDKAVEAGLKLAKVEYNVDANQVNVLGTLNQEEIEKLKAKIAKLRDIESKPVVTDGKVN